VTPPEAFFTVHRDLPREGPGEAADVLWALESAGIGPDARILDAGCGPGADTVTLAEARPGAKVEAVEKQEHFVEEARRRTARFGARVSVRQGDYRELDGRYDFIWCAGAAYFVGIAALLQAWRPHLAHGGVVAFSEPAWMIEPPSKAARAFWEGEYDVMSRAAIEAAIHEAGLGIAGQRWVTGGPWAAYYGPMSARLDRLEETDQPVEVATAITEHRAEIAKWRAAREEIAYALYLVRSE
jgi:SAM-dependent methyltransferase